MVSICLVQRVLKLVKERGRGGRWCWAWERAFEGVRMGEKVGRNRRASQVRKWWEGWRNGVPDS